MSGICGFVHPGHHHHHQLHKGCSTATVVTGSLIYILSLCTIGDNEPALTFDRTGPAVVAHSLFHRHPVGGGCGGSSFIIKTLLMRERSTTTVKNDGKWRSAPQARHVQSGRESVEQLTVRWRESLLVVGVPVERHYIHTIIYVCVCVRIE